MITGLLLAAGAGRRAGGPKALRHDHDGTGWLRRGVRVLLAGGCSEVVVVLGASADAAGRLVRDEPGVSVTVVENWAQGIGASLRCGLDAVVASGAGGACVHLVDLPDVGPTVVARLLDHDHGVATLARAVYRGEPGHPVLVGRGHLHAMAAELTGDDGGRRYLVDHDVTLVECGDLADGRDVDDA
ncbi:MAG: nucleotidyltransferase family protein [Propionibacteriaceae bacterium]